MDKQIHFNMDKAFPAIEMHGISKSFGHVQANRHVSFFVDTGEIHALLGENGSGKSTLMNILSGIYFPDQGVIKKNGEPVIFKSPKDSIRHGIGMVHQHFMLVENLSAVENCVLGSKGIFYNKKKEALKLEQFAHRFNISIDANKKIRKMSVSEKQTVEILKVLYRGARILVLDEPTAVLTPQEIDKLFAILRKMRDNGCAIIFISHKMNEVMDLCDRVTVLRKGETVGTRIMSQTTQSELIEMMVGRSIELSIQRPETGGGDCCLKVSNLTVRDAFGFPQLDQVSFNLEHGEILGVAGLAGSGQKELCESIAGLCKHVTGEIAFHNVSILGKTPREIIRMGISMSFIPEDRLGMGLVASMDIADNVMLKDYAFHPSPFLNRRSARVKAEEIVRRLEISTPSIFHAVRKLSGGNIQKVILGREINLNPKLLITAYAVRGLDINSSYTIYDLLNEQKMKGVAVLYIGEDLDVLLELCDRILVLNSGRLTGIVDARKARKEEIGLMMASSNIFDTEPSENPTTCNATEETDR
ncbi:MAG: ABC transporter ATP-binding protein [Saccharofermentanales bacterium]